MTLRINQNLAAVNAHRNLKRTDRSISAVLEQLTTGLRINRASDDAAGLTISEKLRAQVRGLNRSVLNAQDGISLIQTAEGALQEGHSILQRMRELAVQSANGILTSNDRGEIQREVNQLIYELDRIANNTEFNDKQLLDGSMTAIITTDNKNTTGYIVGDVAKGGDFRIDQEVNQQADGTYQTGSLHTVSTKQWIFEEEVDLLGNISPLQTTSIADNMLVVNSNIAETGPLRLVDAVETFVIEATGVDRYSVYGNINTNTPLAFLRRADGGTGVDFSGGLVINDRAGTNVILDLSGLDSIQDVVDAINDSGAGVSVAVGSGRTGLQLYDTSGGGGNLTISGQPAAGLGLFVDAATSSVAMVNISYVATEITAVEGASIDLVRGDGSAIGVEVSVLPGLRVNESAIFNATTRLYLNADANTKLGDISAFRDANGVSIFGEQRLVVHGNGKQVELFFNSSDTVADVASKLQGALSISLEMGQYWSGAVKSPQLIQVNSAAVPGISYWDDPDGNRLVPETDGNNQTPTAPLFYNTPGTMYISSGVVGDQGKLSFSGDEEFLRAFGFLTAQEPENPVYNISVTNVHTNEVVSSITTSERRINGLIPGLEIEYDLMSDLEIEVDASGDDISIGDRANEPPQLAVKTTDSTTFIHIAPTGIDFHIGANEGQVLSSYIADMGAGALGLAGLSLESSESSERAISTLDDAIGYVSSERSRLGAYQNRLEYAISNLGVASENLSASESRIRDLDFADAMIQFTKNQILMQSGMAMLAQANQLPQSVLQLLG